MTCITASAPGKLVLLGEYAVLEGAPALVLAVNQRVTATLTTIPGPYWEIVSPTLGATARARLAADGVAWNETPPPAELAWIATLLARFLPAPGLPPCRIELDSNAFFLAADRAKVKLGLGSSAALTVALLGALHALAELPSPTLAAAIATHRAIQRGRGSGIDIAASLTGGLQRFELTSRGATTAAAHLPDGLHLACVYSGRPASTRALLATVATWRTRSPASYARHMDELATISSRGIDAMAANDAAAFLSSLHAYASALAAFGEAAGVDIASREHRVLGKLAAACGCVYKSCGAGNGDVGVTFCVDNQCLREFATRATQAGFQMIDLHADPRGLAVAGNEQGCQ